MQDDEKAIEQLYRRWFERMQENDVDALLELVSEDVIYKAPSAPAIVGKKALRESLQTFHARFREEVEHQVVELRVLGDWAYARVVERTRIVPKAEGESTEIRGMHLSILRRDDDGTWLLTRDVGSLDHPSP